MNNFRALARKNRTLLIWFALLTLLCSQRFAGFVMILATPLALLYDFSSRAWVYRDES
jgi:hypothetical protein